MAAITESFRRVIHERRADKEGIKELGKNKLDDQRTQIPAESPYRVSATFQPQEHIAKQYGAELTDIPAPGARESGSDCIVHCMLYQQRRQQRSCREMISAGP